MFIWTSTSGFLFLFLLANSRKSFVPCIVASSLSYNMHGQAIFRWNNVIINNLLIKLNQPLLTTFLNKSHKIQVSYVGLQNVDGRMLWVSKRLVIWNLFPIVWVEIPSSKPKFCFYRCRGNRLLTRQRFLNWNNFKCYIMRETNYCCLLHINMQITFHNF